MGRGGGGPIRPSTFSKGTLAWLVGSVLLALTALASRRTFAAQKKIRFSVFYSAELKCVRKNVY